jgi:hypothetical protein
VIYKPDSQGLFQPVDLLEGAYGTQWRHPIDEVGQGQFDIPSEDPKALAATLAADNLVGCYLNGACRYAFLIETPTETIAAAAGPAGEPWHIEGRGMEAYLDKATVYPAGWPSLVVREVVEQLTPIFGTTVAAAASAGATNLKLVDVTGMTPGIYTVEGSTANEDVTVTVVGTAGAGGTGVTLASGTTMDHGVGDDVSFTSTSRAPSSSTRRRATRS